MSMSLGELEKRIGLLLYQRPRTAEEIAKELGVNLKDVMEALKHMIKLKLVKKEGYPPVYDLYPSIREAVGRKMEPVEGIRVHAIVEVQAIEEELAKKALKQIRERLQKEKGIKVISAEISSIEQTDVGNYSGFIDLELSFEGIAPLIHFIFFYGPSVVDVLGPEKITVDISDLQAGIIEAARMVQGYVTYLTKLMTRKELQEFNKKLFKELLR